MKQPKPQPGIMDIELYVGGKSTVDGVQEMSLNCPQMKIQMAHRRQHNRRWLRQPLLCIAIRDQTTAVYVKLWQVCTGLM